MQGMRGVPGRILICAAAFVMLAAAPSPKDLDNDGVRNRKDECPDTQIGSRVDKVGCPIDSDRDGVADGIDRCSRTAAGWPVGLDGCPTDTDGDGVLDAQDSCASTPTGARVDRVGCTSDADGDRVLDGLDRCDATPTGATTDAFGCPIDTDHDGVLDSFDQCPASRPLESVDAAGCRIKLDPPFPPGASRVVLDGVTFQPNVVDLEPASASVLREVADSLKDWPEGRVEIGVYTDARGDSAKNRALSGRRAQIVREFLVTLGVDAARLTAKGYGEVSPIADNKTEEGRARNRRVQLALMDAPQVAEAR